jgi:hypothetical protein
MAAAWATVSPRVLRSAAEASRPSYTIGGLAALLYALRAHRKARRRTWQGTSVGVVFNADEERLSAPRAAP